MIEQGTPEWFAARLGCVTASRISDVMMKPTTAGYRNYHAQLVCERLTGDPTETFTSPAMSHGTDTEPQARAYYSFVTGNQVDEVGFIPHPKLARSGASPDGLIGADGGLEIKCPQPAKHLDTLTGKPIDRGYLLQMQWGMACTGREWWDFVSFCPKLPDNLRMFRKTIARDPEQIEEITFAVTNFLAEVDRMVAKLEAQREAA